MTRIDSVGIALAAFSILFCVYGFSRIESNTEDVLQWLPDQSHARQDYNLFQSKFGADDFLIVTWEDCTVADPRLPKFSKSVTSGDNEELVQSVTNGAEVAKQLKRSLNIKQKDIAKRMEGVFFGVEDPELTCTLIELTNKGTRNRRRAMEVVWKAIDEVPDLHRADVSIGGYPYIGTFVDTELKNSFKYFMLPSTVFATLVSLFCLRNFGLTMIVFIAAFGASSVSIAIIPACGVKFGGLMSIIPALVFVLTISGSIHLTRYSLDRIGQVRRLLQIGWKPCTFSALTTAIGMLSLARSSFPAIRSFGYFCAAGVGISLIFQLIVVPWLLLRFGQPGLRKLATQNHDVSVWSGLLNQVRRHKIFVNVCCAALMILAARGLTQLTANVEIENMFRQDSEIFKSISAMEQRLGPMDQTELLLCFDSVNADHFSDRVDTVREVQRALERLPEVGVTYSLLNFLPVKPQRSRLRSVFADQLYKKRLKLGREKMARSNFLNIEDATETWRVSLRFPFTQRNDFDGLASHIVKVATESVARSKVEKIGDAQTAVQASTPTLIYTGKTHLFNHAQITLLTDLFKNFLTAFVIITPLLILVLRSLRLGLIAMIPNVFPILMVFGALGWFNFPVDLALAVTACVALGIAVDDTTHFLIRYREFEGSLTNIDRPLALTIAQCGPAMLHTTLIGSAGMIVYYFCSMLVVVRFSWSITLMLVIALLADVVMLPAILLLFGRGTKETSSEIPTPEIQEQQEYVKVTRRTG